MKMIDCFCGMVDQRKVFSLISSQDHCQRSSPLQTCKHAASRIWTCAEPEFKICWKKLCSIDHNYTMAPHNHYTTAPLKRTITLKGDNNAKKRSKKLTFKNSAPIRSCMSKINNTFVDNAEDLNIVMPMYNLLKYSDNCSMTSGSFCNY